MEPPWLAWIKDNMPKGYLKEYTDHQAELSRSFIALNKSLQEKDRAIHSLQDKYNGTAEGRLVSLEEDYNRLKDTVDHMQSGQWLGG